jgi:Zn-dependent peptidase ImmA (M78 family)
MNWIIKKVKEIHQKYEINDLDLLASELGAEIYEILDTKDIKEVYFPDLKAIAIKPNLHPYERNYLIAHALGHHLLHQVGLHRDFIRLHEEGLWGSFARGRIEIARKEREADIFAAYLLIPEEKLNSLLKIEDISISELAEEFQVPEELVEKRLEFKKIFKQE